MFPLAGDTNLVDEDTILMPLWNSSYCKPERAQKAKRGIQLRLDNPFSLDTLTALWKWVELARSGDLGGIKSHAIPHSVAHPFD